MSLQYFISTPISRLLLLMPALLFATTSVAQVTAAQHANNNLSESINHTQQTLSAGKNSQNKVNRLAGETDALLNEYQALLKKTEYQKSYNEELRFLKTEQLQALADLDQQLKDIVITKQQLLPLLREMVQTLEQFIKLDLPFRRTERLTSVDKLSKVLSSSSASISEKYRRVMEMYQAENDYNYDLEVYRDNVTLNDEDLSVQVLRIGRSNLYFQTMDANVSAMWNQESKNWDVLDNKYQLNIRKAMRIASKKAAPELLELPYVTVLDTNANKKGVK
jgi:Skp family chaperone for outer membrane proteins